MSNAGYLKYQKALCAQSSPQPIQNLPVRILRLFICFNFELIASHYSSSIAPYKSKPSVVSLTGLPWN